MKKYSLQRCTRSPLVNTGEICPGQILHSKQTRIFFVLKEMGKMKEPKRNESLQHICDISNKAAAIVYCLVSEERIDKCCYYKKLPLKKKTDPTSLCLALTLPGFLSRLIFLSIRERIVQIRIVACLTGSSTHWLRLPVLCFFKQTSESWMVKDCKNVGRWR